MNTDITADIGRFDGKADGKAERFCIVTDCMRLAAYSSPRLCPAHYRRTVRAGTRALRRPAGPASPSWRGRAVGCQGAHDRVVALHGLARRWWCVACGRARARDYALQPDAADVLTDAVGRRYSPDPADYRPMCRECHAVLDASWRARRVAPDPLPGLDGPEYALPTYRGRPLVPWPRADAPAPSGSTDVAGRRRV